MMDELDGIEVCRRVRATADLRAMYLLLLTSRGSKAHVIEGLKAGANDYVTKPFDSEGLSARVAVGAQVVQLQSELAARVGELEQALARVQRLQGLLPICAYCKSIRDDKDYWHQVDAYLKEHSGVQFTHGVCPTCLQRLLRDFRESRESPVA
jgi:phosphoserine phosphatase RsbU/P